MLLWVAVKTVTLYFFFVFFSIKKIIYCNVIKPRKPHSFFLEYSPTIIQGLTTMTRKTTYGWKVLFSLDWMLSLLLLRNHLDLVLPRGPPLSKHFFSANKMNGLLRMNMLVIMTIHFYTVL